MSTGTPRERPTHNGAIRQVGGVCIALSAFLLAVPHASLHANGRSKTVTASAACLVLTLPSVADVTAGPDVTSPAASVASFSTLALPLVASVVDVCFLHQVTVSRMGGLYGP